MRSLDSEIAMFRFPMLCCGSLPQSSRSPSRPREDSPQPIPAKDAAAASEKSIKDIYKASYLKTKSADRSVLAKTLLDNADDSKGEPATQYVFLREARDVAGKAGDLPLYQAAAKKLAAAFRISTSEAFAGGVDFLAVGLAGSATADNGQTLVDMVDEAVGVGEFAAALKILKGPTRSRASRSPS